MDANYLSANTSYNIDHTSYLSKSANQNDLPYSKLATLPDTPPMLDPLNFSNNQLEEVLNIFCNNSTGAIHAAASPDHLGKHRLELTIR